MTEPGALERRRNLKAAIKAERAALAEQLSGLSLKQWASRSLCDRWSVEEVVAHLIAGARIGQWRWLGSNHHKGGEVERCREAPRVERDTPDRA